MYRCPAGRYGAVEGAKNSMCSGPCLEGYHCDEGSSSATQYECGVIAMLRDEVSKDAAVEDFTPSLTYPTRTDATAYFGDFNTTTELLIGTSDVAVKIINPNNYYCPTGSANPIPVLPGYFSTGGNATTRTYQSPCTIGTYCIGEVPNLGQQLVVDCALRGTIAPRDLFLVRKIGVPSARMGPSLA